jgi:hypothetical protein
MIEESAVRNSGIPQGVFMRRMIVEGMEPFDLRIGKDYDFNGTVFHTYACDEFTDWFFKQRGVDVGEFETPPDDLYTIRRKLTDRPIRVSKINTDKTHLRQFLDYDKKVLRFSAIWDDRKAIFGERRKFVFLYFLVNDTIEVRQVLSINSGRDPVSRFLSKTKVQHPTEKRPYNDGDLKIGAVINVFNREFLLYDADQFTRDFLDQKHGKHDWTPINIDDYFSHKKIQIKPPPHNGWGTEEDSLGFVYSLHPNPPKKDVVKLIEKDGMILRFIAKFVDPIFQDKDRIFALCFYLADDTVSILEKFQRNSGFGAGRFLNRGRYRNDSAGGRYFEASDFAVGKQYVINKYKFVTLEADEYAINYMESQSPEFPQADLSQILTPYLKRTDVINSLRKGFEGHDPELQGFISSKEATSVVQEVLKLPVHETGTIVRRFETPYGFDYFNLVTSLG